MERKPAYGKNPMELDAGESSLYSSKSNDSMEGLEEVMGKFGLECAKSAMNCGCMQFGGRPKTFRRSGRVFMIWWRGNREYEIVRLDDVDS